ncbi:MAG: MFS transporter [Gammaproteobacteria bacterium]|nr:MFS transporter [Gammaproteobacteria bacterium]
MTNTSGKIFYGWWNVATGFVGMALCYGIFTVFAFGVFVGPLQEEFGWNRGELSFALSMTNFAVVIASPLLGLLIDKYGVRKILIPSVVLMSICIASMGLLTANIWHLYLLYFLIPFLGAGTLPQSYSRVLIAWFNRRRGFALGLSLSGFGVGAMLIPVVAQSIIEVAGWRVSYFIFAATVFLLALPMAIFFMRESPQEMGLSADGDTATKDQPDNDSDLTGLSGMEAMKTSTYWLILFSFLLVGIGLTGVLAHLYPLLVDRGLSPQLAARCMASIGPGIIIGRIVAGYLMDRFFAPYVTAFFLLGMVAGISILASGTTSMLVFAAALLVGMASGSEISEIAYICSRYFGKKAFGQIYGIMFAAFQVGAIFGAPLMGFYYDRAGNYIGALWLLAGIVTLPQLLLLYLNLTLTNLLEPIKLPA